MIVIESYVNLKSFKDQNRMERSGSIRIYVMTISNWIHQCKTVLQIRRVFHKIPEQISYPNWQQENLIAVGHVQITLVQPGFNGIHEG